MPSVLVVCYDTSSGKYLVKSAGTSQIADLAITSAKIGLLAVGTPHLADGAVTSAKIASGYTTPLVDGAVTSAKIASGQVGDAHIYPGSILSAKIGANAVGVGHIVESELSLANLGEKAHGSLTGVTADLHHNRSHDHSLAADGSPIAVAGVPNLPAGKVTSGRFPMTRMPDMVLDKIMVGQGAGNSPVEEDKPVAEVGGLYGINVETLAGDKTLTPGTDKIYQYLDEGGANRTITLDTASATAGDRFVIRHNGIFSDIHRLTIKQAAIELDLIYARGIKEFIFDGTNWISRGVGTAETGTSKNNLAVGYSARGHNYGTAFGYAARGETWGIGIGFNARGDVYGVAAGSYANGNNYGVAIGHQTDTNGKRYSIALGSYSECERYGETSININGSDTDQENNVVQGRWERELAGGAGATEIFSAGQINQRFTVRASSHLAFRITVVARDNVANEGAMYTFEGLIKRDAASNTVMSICNKIVVHEDDATWDCNVTADDVNEALTITCTGDGANITQWAAVMNGVETHF